MRDLIGLRPRLLLQPGVCDRDRAFGKKIVPTSTFFVHKKFTSQVSDAAMACLCVSRS